MKITVENLVVRIKNTLLLYKSVFFIVSYFSYN